MDKKDLIADEKMCNQYIEKSKASWTKEILMGCLKRIVHKDVFTKIASNFDVLQFTKTEPFDNKVVKKYLQYLITKPELRLQMFNQKFGTIGPLFLTLNCVQDISLFYKYINLPHYHYKKASTIFGKIGDNPKFECFSKTGIILLLHLFLRNDVGTKEADMVCGKAIERLDGCYELVPVDTFAKILDVPTDKVTVESVEKILAKNEELFKPYPNNGTISNMDLMPMPTVRIFNDEDVRYCFSKEVEKAIRIAFTKKYAEKELDVEKISKFVRLDNKEDRALGIMHIVEIDKVNELLTSLELTMEDLFVVTYPKNNFHRVTFHLPYISPYGTHCNLAMYMMTDLLDYLIMDLRVFQRVKRANLWKITKWLKSVENVFDRSRNYQYIVDVWKLDELKEKAHIELNRYLTEPVYNLPVKPFFTKRELIEEIKKFSPVHNIEIRVFEHFNYQKMFGPKYDYWQTYYALLKGTHSDIIDSHQFKPFFEYQKTMCFGQPNEYSHMIESYKKAIQEVTLPPAIKCGKNNLGEVAVPKSKKNIKPDFSKKIDKEAVVMEALKCFSQHFEKFQSFKIEKLKEYFEEYKWEYLKEVLENKDKRKEIEKVFDVDVKNGVYTLKRKSSEVLTAMIIGNIGDKKMLEESVEKLKNDRKLKENEIEGLNRKIGDTVQKSVEKIKKLTEESGKTIQELQKQLETANKKIGEAEKKATAQVSSVKQSYREELSKLKEDNDVKNAKNQQLQKELKESREELRKERENKFAQNDEQLKMAEKNMEKMRREVEDLKLWKTKKSKEIGQLTKEKSDLETQLDIAKGKNTENENKDNIIEQLISTNEQLNFELQNMTEYCYQPTNSGFSYMESNTSGYTCEGSASRASEGNSTGQSRYVGSP